MYTVLVVDDDPQVLDVLAKVLAEPGYTVVTARDAFEAIRTLADRHIDLLMTDIMMPGLDGIQLAIQAKVMRPRLRIIYITGFEGAGKQAKHGRVVEKPIRAAALIETVKRELATS